MAQAKSKKSNTAPRHLKAPDTPKGSEREERTAAHRSSQRAKRNAAAAGVRKEQVGYNSQELYREKLRPYAENRHAANERALRAGLGWLFALPVILLIFQKLTNHDKIVVLLIWVVGMFIISGALVYVAYIDHELKKYLKTLTECVPNVEEPELDHVRNAAEKRHADAGERSRKTAQNGSAEKNTSGHPSKTGAERKAARKGGAE